MRERREVLHTATQGPGGTRADKQGRQPGKITGYLASGEALVGIGICFIGVLIGPHQERIFAEHALDQANSRIQKSTVLVPFIDGDHTCAIKTHLLLAIRRRIRIGHARERISLDLADDTERDPEIPRGRLDDPAVERVDPTPFLEILDHVEGGLDLDGPCLIEAF